MNSSSASAPSRIDWRPSRLAQALLALLAVLAVLALWRSGLPVVLQGGATLGVLGYAGWRLRREARRPPAVLIAQPGRPLAWQAAGRTVPLYAVRLQRRAGLVQLEGRGADGRRYCVLWWPDTLDAAQRRQLTLAVQAAADGSEPPLVAG